MKSYFFIIVFYFQRLKTILLLLNPQFRSPGLEYVIEIQHNTVKTMEHVYACLLCEERIKTKDNGNTTIRLIKNHIKSSAHKLKYLVSISISLVLLVLLIGGFNELRIINNMNVIYCWI